MKQALPTWIVPASRPEWLSFRRWIDPRMVDLVIYKTYADLRAEAAKTYINYL